MKYIKKLNINFNDWDEIETVLSSNKIEFNKLTPPINMIDILSNNNYSENDEILISDNKGYRKSKIMKILKNRILLNNRHMGHNGKSISNIYINECNNTCWWYSYDNLYNLIIYKKI